MRYGLLTASLSHIWQSKHKWLMILHTLLCSALCPHSVHNANAKSSAQSDDSSFLKSHRFTAELFVFTIWLGTCNVIGVCAPAKLLCTVFCFAHTCHRHTNQHHFWVKNMQTIFGFPGIRGGGGGVQTHVASFCLAENAFWRITNCENGNMKCCTYIESYTNNIQCDTLCGIMYGNVFVLCVCVWVFEYLSCNHNSSECASPRKRTLLIHTHRHTHNSILLCTAFLFIWILPFKMAHIWRIFTYPRRIQKKKIKKNI